MQSGELRMGGHRHATQVDTFADGGTKVSASLVTGQKHDMTRCAPPFFTPPLARYVRFFHDLTVVSILVQLHRLVDKSARRQTKTARNNGRTTPADDGDGRARSVAERRRSNANTRTGPLPLARSSATNAWPTWPSHVPLFE